MGKNASPKPDNTPQTSSEGRKGIDISTVGPAWQDKSLAQAVFENGKRGRVPRSLEVRLLFSERFS